MSAFTSLKVILFNNLLRTTYTYFPKNKKLVYFSFPREISWPLQCRYKLLFVDERRYLRRFCKLFKDMTSNYNIAYFTHLKKSQLPDLLIWLQQFMIPFLFLQSTISIHLHSFLFLFAFIFPFYLIRFLGFTPTNTNRCK